MILPKIQSSRKPSGIVREHNIWVISIFQNACVAFLDANAILSCRRNGAFYYSQFGSWSDGRRKTKSTLLTFVYAMMNHPEVQFRAQAEIDRVVGRQRLPDFEDRASLPYVDAVLRETMRWSPVVTMGALNLNITFLDLLTCRSSSCGH